MRYFTAIITFIFIFSSCVDKPNNDLMVFRVTEEGLQQSIKTISNTNEIIYRSLEERFKAPQTKEYAENWYFKAKKIRALSDSVVKYIASLKEELKSEAGNDNPGDEISYKEDNSNAVNHLFNDHEKGKELFDNLIRYRQQVLAIDPELNNVFNHTIILFARGFDHTKADPAAFTKTFVNNVPAVAAMAILSKFENNIKINENALVSFCHNKTNPVMIIDDFFTPLISLSSSHVRPGDEMELTAGIGSFSSSLNTKVIVDGRSVITDNGVATYTFRASREPGEHNVKVAFDFIGPRNDKIALEKWITYTVIK